MFLKTPAILIRCVASLALALWGVSAHHDVLLDLAGLDHHHDHHLATDHPRPYQHGGHSHSGDTEHDHRDSIPLPDTHGEPVTLNFKKVVVEEPKQAPATNFWLLASFGSLLFWNSDFEIEAPPRLSDSDLSPPALILLAHSVQSNAPPSLS